MKTIELDNNKWIGEQIEDDIPKWNKGDIITIEAGTGTGKSYFIKNDLYKHAKTNGKKILMLVHRVNTREQFRIELGRHGKLDIVDVLTYQTIDAIEKTDDFDFSKYEYIICDEFHYFTSDSGFNDSTELSLSAILEEINITRVFMSATADSVLRYFKNEGVVYLSYVSELDFSYIDNLYFYSDDETEESIIDSVIKNNEKAIVFINRDSRMQELYNKYKDSSLLNCSKSNINYNKVDSLKITKMLSQEIFAEPILITTSVMDTGVSIKDVQLKSIVCNNIVDKNVLIQVLGRKRQLNEDDKIDVYIRVIENRQIGGHITGIKKELESLNEYVDFGGNYYVSKYGRKRNTGKSFYYDIGDDGKPKLNVNRMVLYKMAEDLKIYTDILEVGYSNYIADVLGFDNFVEVEKEMEKDMLEEYLESIVGKRLYVGSDKRQRLISLIDLRDAGGGLVKGYKTISAYVEDKFEQRFIIVDKMSYKNDSYRRKYWQVLESS